MHKRLQHDLSDIDSILEHAHTLAKAYLHGLHNRPAAADLTSLSLPPVALPAQGIGAHAALEKFERDYAPWLSGSPGPRYFGFVTGGATPAALAADWLVSTYDQNTQRNGDTCAAAVELQALRLLLQLLEWPDEWTGVCVTGATMANFVGIALARQWYGKHWGRDIAQDGLAELPPVTVMAATAHSSILKAMSMAGIGRKQCHQLPMLDGREAMDIDALEQALQERAGTPCIVSASAGTVTTVDFDDLRAIGELKKRYNFWLHVDAAFGGIAAASRLYRNRLDGIVAADSVTVDAHKWLNLPYDCAMLFTPHLLLQLEVFQNSSPYLPPPTPAADNFLHLAPENSRRFRALPLWASLLAYGREGYAEIVERNCASAQRLAMLLDNDPRFRLAAPVHLNVVCFDLAEGDSTDLERLRQALHLDGTAFVSPGSIRGRPLLRAAICNWRTTDEDIDRTFAALQRLTDMNREERRAE